MMGVWHKHITGFRAVYLGVLAQCILCSLTSLAQRYPFHNLSVDDGLIQSQATCLTQDRSGNLWIGTLGGLSRYDGHNFTSFTIRNGLRGNAVWAVATDSAGRIWIGGANEISVFNGKSMLHYTRPGTQAVRAINNTQQIFVVHDTTWWRVAGDVYFVTAGAIHRLETPGPDAFVTSILAGTTGLFLAKEGYVYHSSGKKWDSLKLMVAADQKPPTVSRLFRAPDGRLWAGTTSGLYRQEMNSLVPVILSADLFPVQPSVTAIASDKSGAVWLGTGKGVVRLEGGNAVVYSKHNGLSDNSFMDAFTDMEGNVWLASDGQGVFRYSGTQFTGLDESMGLPSAQVMAFASNGRDSLFLGTYDAGLYVFKEGKVGPLSFPSSPVPAITTLCYSSGSRLWIGTRGRGLWSYDDGIFRQYEAPGRNFPSNFINRLYEDPYNRLWIGFANGAVLYEHDSFKTVPVKTESVLSFLAINNDSVLIATEFGLKLYSRGNVSEFKTNNIVEAAKIQCLILKDRELWMGSSDNGIIRYNLDSRKTVVITKADGLRSDFIYNIIADNEGNIWAGTGFGIHRIKVNEQGEPKITFYGKAQGITGMESNINSVLRMPDSSIWFGTTNGALHYQPHTPVVSAAPASIILQSVKLTDANAIDPTFYDSTDNWYGIPYHLRLPLNRNSIAFTFQAISLSGAEQIQYRYRMEGLDAPWSQWSATNSVSYSALPPGQYVFRVQCQGADDASNPELTYSFEIITPFQKTRWFRISVLIGCIVAGIILQYIAGQRKQRRLRLLAKLRAEEQSKIRLRTAEDFHDEIGNKLTRINVLTNVLKNKISLTPETARILGQIEENTGQLYGGTRDILWSLKPSNDNLYEILHRIRDFAGELFEDTEIDFTFTGTDEKWRNYRLPMDMSRNLIMIFKEALNNCLKYSNATKVSLEFGFKTKGVLQMILRDNGKGFDMRTIDKGNGINNMNVRAGRLKGKLYIDSRIGKGTIISLTFRLPKYP